jgi:DNA-binding transcriptional LysR family regulator
MVRLDDMRLAAALADAGSFTAVGERLEMPKQTVSRRVAALEAELGLRLVDRTTRAFRLTDAGRRYAERCAEILRLADEAADEARGQGAEVTGTVRVTADPLLGELFLPPIVTAFLAAYPKAGVDAVLTSRLVDLVEEGFDVAFRVGELRDSSLVAQTIAPARLVYVASPRYLRARGTPRSPGDLAGHDCIALAPEGSAARWAFAEAGEVRWLRVAARVRVNSLAMARQAALDGLGITNLPRFACAGDIADGRLVPLLGAETGAFGAIHVVHPSRRLVPARVRAFVTLAVQALRARPELRDDAPARRPRQAKAGAHRSG